jgi:hypothetical protein
MVEFHGGQPSFDRLVRYDDRHTVRIPVAELTVAG